MKQKIKHLFGNESFRDTVAKNCVLVNQTKGTTLDVESITLSISHLNFQTSNSFTVDVSDFSEVENGDRIELVHRVGKVVIYSGIAYVTNKFEDYLRNKKISVSLEMPNVGRREFRKVILSDSFNLDYYASNPDDIHKSVLHAIAKELGFRIEDEYLKDDNGDFILNPHGSKILVAENQVHADLAKYFYQVGTTKISDIPFSLFKKGERWIDELTTLCDALGGYLFVDENFHLRYRSYMDIKYKSVDYALTDDEIIAELPYNFNPGTNNGVKVDFDRFEMATELRDVFRAEKKIYAKSGESFDLNFKYVTNVVTAPAVKSCKVYYYEGETPIYLPDYKPYVTFTFSASQGMIKVNNTYSKDIYIDDVVVEGFTLTMYADNSTVLKNSDVEEELQEDFLSISKNKYIQSFHASRSRAIREYYGKVKPTDNIEIQTRFLPFIELGDKVSVRGIDYCVDGITHVLDERRAYRSKFKLINICDPDLLNIKWREVECVNATKPQDLVNAEIEDEIETVIKPSIDASNNYTEEVKEQLEQQLAQANKDLEDAKVTINQNITDTKTELEGIVSTEIQNVNSTITSVETILGDKISANTSSIEQNASDISLRVTNTTYEKDMNTLNERVEKNASDIKLTAEEIELNVNTQISSLDGRLTTAEGSIVTNAGQIALRATKTELNTAMGTVNEKFAEIDITTDGITQTVTNNYTDLEGKITANTSSITQNANSINLKVEAIESDLATTDGLLNSGKHLVSTINLDSGGVTLQGSKIDMNSLKTTINATQGIFLNSDKVDIGNGTIIVNGSSTTVASAVTGAQNTANTANSTATTANNTANSANTKATNAQAGHVQINANTQVTGVLTVQNDTNGIISLNGAGTKRVLIRGGSIVFQEWV